MKYPKVAKCQGCGHWFWYIGWYGKYGKAGACSQECCERSLDELAKELTGRNNGPNT